MDRFEFGYTDTATGLTTSFSLGGISDDVAKGIRFGLKKVPTITDVTAQRITENRQAVAPDTP